HRRELVGRQVHVDVPGGTLAVTLDATVQLGGPVVHVFDVDVNVDAVTDLVDVSCHRDPTRTASAAASPPPRSISNGGSSARSWSAPASARAVWRKPKPRSTSSCSSPRPRA